MSTIGYARVSTADQDLALQLDALQNAGAERVFSDVASGAKADRPQLTACLEQLTAGDTLIVWRLDRLGRSLRHLVELVEDLKAREVQLRSIHDGIDTRTPAGRLQLGIFASLAEFERELISERTKAGLAAARRRGNEGGRRPVITAAKMRAAAALLAEGLTVREAAEAVGVSKTALYDALKTAKAQSATVN